MTNSHHHFESVETLSFPPDNPTLRIPLTGAVELELDSVEQPTTPEAKLEAFLDSHAAIFGAVDTAWRNVKVAQQTCTDVTNNIRLSTQAENPTRRAPRGIRRASYNYFKNFMNLNAQFGTAKHEGAQLYKDRSAAWTPDKPIAERNAELTRGMSRFYADVLEDLNKQLDAQVDELDMVKGFMSDFTQARVVVTIANTYALFRQDVALERTEQFLEDPAVVPSFTERIYNLARANENPPDYPGLLELIATHIERSPQDNIILNAMRRAAPKPEAYAYEYIQNLANRKELPKELSEAISVMDIMADIVDTRFGLERQDLLQLFAERVDQWPPEFSARLQTFANGKLMQEWKRLKDSLESYVRPGRLPAEVSQQIIDKPSEKRKNDIPPVGKPATIKGRVVTPPKLNMARARQDHLDVAEFASEPITQFCILQGGNDRQGKRFRVEHLEDQQDMVFEFTNLDEYIKKHAADPSVGEVLKAMIDHLTKNPKDPVHTKQLRGVTYELVREDGQTLERNPRRFSPQHFPLKSKGPIASKTRLIYDVISHQGKPALVIYGAFIKQDIENLSGRLPSIR